MGEGEWSEALKGGWKNTRPARQQPRLRGGVSCTHLQEQVVSESVGERFGQHANQADTAGATTPQVTAPYGKRGQVRAHVPS